MDRYKLEAGMIGRRALLGLAPAALVFLRPAGGRAYFGSTVLPQKLRLVHTLGGKIESLDPAKSTGSHEFYVIPALFEGLTQYHPELPTLWPLSPPILRRMPISRRCSDDREGASVGAQRAYLAGTS